MSKEWKIPAYLSGVNRLATVMMWTLSFFHYSRRCIMLRSSKLFRTLPPPVPVTNDRSACSTCECEMEVCCSVIRSGWTRPVRRILRGQNDVGHQPLYNLRVQLHPLHRRPWRDGHPAGKKFAPAISKSSSLGDFRLSGDPEDVSFLSATPTERVASVMDIYLFWQPATVLCVDWTVILWRCGLIKFFFFKLQILFRNKH